MVMVMAMVATPAAIPAVPAMAVIVMVVPVMVVVAVAPAPVQQVAPVVVACTGKHDVTCCHCKLWSADDPIRILAADALMWFSFTWSCHYDHGEAQSHRENFMRCALCSQSLSGSTHYTFV